MEYIPLIISLSIGLLIGYLTAYTKEKAKNKALKQDIADITRKSETVITEFKLQLEKRKHQYEKKHQVYSRYHNLLDKFDSENSLVDPNKTEPIMTDLVNALYKHQDNESEKMKALNVFGDKFNIMVREAMSGLKEIAIETNEIKLVGSIEINEILKKLNANYKEIGRISELEFKDANKVLIGEVDFLSINKQMKKLGSDTDKLKIECINLMRNDLENI